MVLLLHFQAIKCGIPIWRKLRHRTWESSCLTCRSFHSTCVVQLCTRRDHQMDQQMHPPWHQLPKEDVLATLCRPHCVGLTLQVLYLVSLSAQHWAIRCGAMTWRSLSTRIWGSFNHTCRSFRRMCMVPSRTRRLTSRPLRHGIISQKRTCCPPCLHLSLMPRLHPLIRIFLFQVSLHEQPLSVHASCLVYARELLLQSLTV